MRGRQQPDCELKKWQTWWSVTGPKLPTEELRFNDRITLAPLDEAGFQRSKNRRAPTIQLDTSLDSHLISYPPRDQVQSRHRLQIDVEAAAEDAATAIAQRLAHQFLVAMSVSIPGRRYHAELRMTRCLGQQETTSWSEPAQVAMFLEPIALAASDLDVVRDLFKSVNEDPIAENAYVHLLTAWQLQTTAGSKPLQRSILQHYVLCMEAIVNGTMNEIRKSRRDEIRLAERKFAADFAETLQRRADKPEAIRSASTELRNIGLINTAPSISVVAQVLSIPDEVRELAIALYRFRSSNLSHPGRDKPEALQRWLAAGPTVDDFCTADIVARNFLTAYCLHVHKRA